METHSTTYSLSLSHSPLRLNASRKVCCNRVGGMPSIATNCDEDVGDMCCMIGYAKGINLAAPLSMFLSGICGNILALIVLYKSRVESQRTVFYTLLAGLIWTDLIGQITTSILPIVVHSRSKVDVDRNRTIICWIGGQVTCHLHAFLMITIGLITPCFVAFMAIERVVCLKRWYFYSQTVTKRRARIAIFIMWSVVILFAILPLMGFGTYALQFPGTWCFLNFHANDTGTVYALTYAAVNCALIVLTIICNLIVITTLLHVRHARKALVGLNRTTTSSKKIYNDCPQSVASSMSGSRKLSSTVVCACTRVQKNIMKDLEIQMVVLLGAITVGFTVCWAPLMIQIFINELTGITNYRSDLRAVHMASINQILDPWVYILFRKSNLSRIAGVILRVMRINSKNQMKGFPPGTATPRGTPRPGKMRHIVAQPVVMMAGQQGQEMFRLALQRVNEERNAGELEMSDSPIPVENQLYNEVNTCACSCHQDPMGHSVEMCQFPITSSESLKMHRKKSGDVYADLSKTPFDFNHANDQIGCWPSFRGSLTQKQSARRSISIPRDRVTKRPSIFRQISAPFPVGTTTNAHIHSISSGDSGISDQTTKLQN